jgi:hypothetical protein
MLHALRGKPTTLLHRRMGTPAGSSRGHSRNQLQNPRQHREQALLGHPRTGWCAPPQWRRRPLASRPPGGSSPCWRKSPRSCRPHVPTSPARTASRSRQGSWGRMRPHALRWAGCRPEPRRRRPQTWHGGRSCAALAHIGDRFPLRRGSGPLGGPGPIRWGRLRLRLPLPQLLEWWCCVPAWQLPMQRLLAASTYFQRSP